MRACCKHRRKGPARLPNSAANRRHVRLHDYRLAHAQLVARSIIQQQRPHPPARSQRYLHGPRQLGHPRDNIGVALAAADEEPLGKDLVRAIRLAYEMYGRLLDMGDPESSWDHVTVSGLVTAGTAGWLLELSTEQLANALALAAMHFATLGEVVWRDLRRQIDSQCGGRANGIHADAVGRRGNDRARTGDRGTPRLRQTNLRRGRLLQIFSKRKGVTSALGWIEAISLLHLGTGADIGGHRNARQLPQPLM